MALELAFRRLAIRPTSLCQECRRPLSTSAATRKQQLNETATLAATLQTSSAQSTSRPSPSQTFDSANTSPPPPPPPTTTTTTSPTDSAKWSLVESAVKTAIAPRRDQAQRQLALELSRGWSAAELERQALHRYWQTGDVYAPHDLTGIEMANWRKTRRRPKPKFDVIDSLGLKPIDLYKNFSIMSEYMTEMGRIRHSNDTNLRPVNQRRMAKALRRAIGVGILMPSTHRHPEILRMEMQKKLSNQGGY